jgi:hypothetical protein
MQTTQTTATERTDSTTQAAQAEAANRLIRLYHVTSVDKAQGPAGAAGDWYRYVLEGGRSPITGLRRGSRSEVTEHAKRCASELNERNSGRSPSAWAPRKTRQS